tara:strand:- start:170 stop:1435 length:1266 start_codon:yes stop_codon:yes gene_type:complete
MIIEIVMPKMGESINEGTIIEWRKEVGEKIELDEILLEIGTDKVDSEIPSSAAGVVVEILAKPNDVKEVGEVIAKIDTDDKENKKITDSGNSKENSEKKSNQEIIVSSVLDKKKTTYDTTNKKDKVFYTPVVMKIAAENELSLNQLEQINGTGRSGRVTKKDILSYLDSPLLPPKIDLKSNKNLNTQSNRTEEMHHMRKIISRHMIESLNTSAHVYVMTEVDMTSIVDFVVKENEKFKEREGYNLTYTPFIVNSVVKSLKEYPEMNSSLSGTTINYHREINIGIAVAIDNGLLVPSIANCEERNFLGLCRSVNDVAIRAREGGVNIDELSGTTFSITNFGIFGVSSGTPIINQPNVGILGVGAIKKQPVVIESEEGDSIAIRSMMILTLGFDHRLIDGAGGSRFIESIRKNIEEMELGDIF